MKYMEKNNVIFTGKKCVRVSVRVERLLQFLSEYKELWYENGMSLDEKIALITSSKKKQNQIKALYNQAEDDYAALRAIRSRMIDHKKCNIKTNLYDITDEQIEALRQAGIGRTFGLSDENQAEYDRLIQAGADESVVQYIFKKFSSYQRFKDRFCEELEKGKERELLAKYKKSKITYASDIDLSEPGGRRTTDRNYVEFLRSIFGADYIIFNGTKLVENIEAFISKYISILPINADYIIHHAYGLGVEKKSSEQIRRELGTSNSWVRQILATSMAKLSEKKAKLLDTVYLFEKSDVVRFLADYYKKNDVLMTNTTQCKSNPMKQQGNMVEVQDIGLSTDLYCDTFARSLRAMMGELEESRALVSNEQKVLFDEQLGRFEKLGLRDFFLGRMSIDKFGLSTRTFNCLSNENIETIDDLIKYTRDSQYSIKHKVKNMGEKSYKELIDFVRSLGLSLEDEDKSDRTRGHNDKLLNRMSKTDACRLALYIEQTKWRIKDGILHGELKHELEERINSIKEAYGIKISNNDLIKIVTTRINQLDKRFYCDTPIDILEVPDEIIKVLKSHGIKSIPDFYGLRARDVNYIKKTYGAYFDIFVAELNRMGLQYPITSEIPVNMMKQATYMNRTNIEFLTYLINESDIEESEKKRLMELLLDKVAQFDKSEFQDVDKRLKEKIEELRGSYQALEERKETLSELEEKQNETNTDPDDEFGDII